MRAGILLCAVGFLPLGLTSVDAAAEGDDRVADKTEAVELVDVLGELAATGVMDGKLAYEIFVASEETRMRELVAASRTTPEAFERELGMAMRLAIAGAEMKQAVAEGKMTEADVKARLEGMRKAMAEGGERGSGDDGIWRRVAVALGEAGIPREQIRSVIGAMHRIIQEIRSEGEAFELDPRLRAYLEGLGLTGKQIELVVGLSGRIAAAPADSGRGPAGVRAQWDGIERRVEAAVERGDVTREETDATYKRIRERMAAGRGR